MVKKFMALVFVVALIAIIAVPLTGMTSDIGIEASNCYLVESGSGAVLYAKGENERKEIASMVKIMTLLLTFEAIERGEAKYDDKVVISDYAAAQKGSELFIDAGQEYTLNDLIKGIVVVSANDASIAVAEYLAKDESSFVNRMNARAKELGMVDTVFANPTGYPSEAQQYSTAKDVNAMTRALIRHDKYYEYSSIWVEDYTHPSGRVTGLANTNKLVRFYKGCDSGKTGHTNSAKYCLSASAKRDNMRVVGTVLGAQTSQSRFDAVRGLFNYAFMNYKAETMVSANQTLEIDIKISNGKLDSIQPIAKNDLVALKTRDSKEISLEYEYGEIKAPMCKGDTVGKINLVSGGKVISSVDMILPIDVQKATYWDNIKKLV